MGKNYKLEENLRVFSYKFKMGIAFLYIIKKAKPLKKKTDVTIQELNFLN